MKIAFQIIGLFFIITLITCTEDTSMPGDPDTSGPENFTALFEGSFMGQNGYSASGTTKLGKDDLNNYWVRLDNNFNTTFATGSVTMYLSKQSNLNLPATDQHIKLGVINKKGQHYFKLNNEPTSDFKFVIVWCAPAKIQFGVAPLN